MRFCLVASAAACLLATATAATAATARVLVVGADASLVHDAVASALTPSDLARRFSPAGLAQLAMDALGLPTGSTPQLLVQSPVQADVFSHVDAYAMVFVDAADADVLSTVDASATSGYHKLFDVTPDETAQVQTIPSALARAMGSSVGARVQCAGAAPLCSDATRARVTKPQVDAVFEKYAFLDREADATLAATLAQTRALAADLRTAKASPNTLVAVHFDAVRQPKARDAVAAEIHDLLAALQTTYPHNSGAQVVAASSSSSVAALQSTTVSKSILAYGRMLLSFNEKLGSSSADEDDEDDDDDDTLLANGTAKSDITIDDIAEYQIVLWTSVILGAALLLVIIAMCNMNNRRDSLLYAKFTTSNASRKFD